MTAYVASGNVDFTNSNVFWFTVKAGDFPIKLSRVDLAMTWRQSTTSGFRCRCEVHHFDGSNTPSGTTNNITPLREGSVASTAVAKGGGSSPGGTNTIIGYFTVTEISTSSWEPPVDFIATPGHTFALALLPVTTEQLDTVTVYFEEIHLSWHF